MSPHRDPETGQFVSGSNQYDDIEVATFGASVGVQASNLGGGTGFQGAGKDDFEGLELVDYDDIVDRNEELRLLSAQHMVAVYANSTATADGTVSAAVEISADPSLSGPTISAADPGTAGLAPDDAVGNAQSDDTIDLVGRPLVAVGIGQYSDGGGSKGGGGSAGEDRVNMDMAPAEFGRFHPRDELFANGRIETWNVSDRGVHVNIAGQHVYGVVES